MGRAAKPETVADWCGRNGATVKLTKVSGRKTVGSGSGARHYKAELDMDGVDTQLIVDWTEMADEPHATDPETVVADIRDLCVLIEQVKDDADAVKGQFALEEDKDWKLVLNEMADVRARFQAWSGPTEFAKLMKTALVEEGA
jgi:hypothetical protein